MSRYQQTRLTEKASPKTINLEVGTLRAILRRYRVWADIQQDVRMLPTIDDVGHALTDDHEAALADGVPSEPLSFALPYRHDGAEFRDAIQRDSAAAMEAGGFRREGLDGREIQDTDR